MTVNELIDRFVIAVAQTGGTFQSIDDAPWIAALEQKLPRSLPLSFRALVTRYAFVPFEVGGLSFYANAGTDDHDELSVAIFRDRFIAGATLKAGYIQFARPADGSYDPICFDIRNSVRESPIVRLDHEEILCYERIRVSQAVSRSFYRFAADIAGGT
jgi:SMI1 / KNR4 family (SUKH-1)